MDRAFQVKTEGFCCNGKQDHVHMVPVGRMITKGMNSIAAALNQEDQNLALKKMIAVIQANLVKVCKLGRSTEKEGASLEKLRRKMGPLWLETRKEGRNSRAAQGTASGDNRQYLFAKSV